MQNAYYEINIIPSIAMLMQQQAPGESANGHMKR